MYIESIVYKQLLRLHCKWCPHFSQRTYLKWVYYQPYTQNIVDLYIWSFKKFLNHFMIIDQNYATSNWTFGRRLVWIDMVVEHSESVDNSLIIKYLYRLTKTDIVSLAKYFFFFWIFISSLPVKVGDNLLYNLLLPLWSI